MGTAVKSGVDEIMQKLTREGKNSEVSEYWHFHTYPCVLEAQTLFMILFPEIRS